MRRVIQRLFKGSQRVFHIRACGLLFSVVASSLLVFAPEARGNSLVFGDVAAFVGTGTTWGTALGLDAAGNTYTLGYFDGTTDFDPGDGVFNMTSTSFQDVFVCKLDATGAFQWAKHFQIHDVSDIAVDASGNVHIVGSLNGSADFDPGPGVFTLASTGAWDAFICKLNADGVFQWAGVMGGAGSDFGRAIALDSAGGVFIGGYFDGTADFDPGPGTHAIANVGGSDAFLCKLDASGAFHWARAIGGDAVSASCDDIAVDGTGAIHTTGIVQGSDVVDFDPGPGAYNLSGAGDLDVFVLKLDDAGNFLRAATIGGTGGDRGIGIATDVVGNSYVTGYFSETVDFDPGPGQYNLTSSGGHDALVLKLDASGALQWAAGFGGPGEDSGYGIVVDTVGNVYSLGSFEGVADLDPGLGSVPVSGIGIENAFISKLDAAGSFVWASALPTGHSESGRTIAMDNASRLYATGRFRDTVDFDPGTGIAETSSLVYPSAFVLQWEAQSLPVANGDAGETSADAILSSLSSPEAASLLANDSDANAAAILTVTAYDATSQLGATVLVNLDGTFLYDPTAVPVLNALAPDEQLTDSFTYTMSDGTDSTVGVVTVTVFGKDAMLPAVTYSGLTLLSLLLGCAGAWLWRGAAPRGRRRTGQIPSDDGQSSLFR